MSKDTRTITTETYLDDEYHVLTTLDEEGEKGGTVKTAIGIILWYANPVEEVETGLVKWALGMSLISSGTPHIAAYECTKPDRASVEKYARDFVEGL